MIKHGERIHVSMTLKISFCAVILVKVLPKDGTLLPKAGELDCE